MKNLIIILLIAATGCTAQKQIQSQPSTPVETMDKWEIERDLEIDIKY